MRSRFMATPYPEAHDLAFDGGLEVDGPGAGVFAWVHPVEVPFYVFLCRPPLPLLNRRMHHRRPLALHPYRFLPILDPREGERLVAKEGGGVKHGEDKGAGWSRHYLHV